MPDLSNETPRPRGLMFPILFTVFLDMLGVSLIIPVLSPLIVKNSTGLLGAHPTELYSKIIYGVLLGLYPVMQFFGAPLLGTLSDRVGRKPMLALSIAGSMVGYVLFAWGILQNQLWMLFLGRAIDGFTGGNISIVFSAIADISTPSTRTRNFGMVGMMFGLGFIIGPFVGGVLSDRSLVSWFGPQIPFWTAGILTLGNLALIYANFPETMKKPTQRAINPLAGFTNISTAFRMPGLAPLYSTMFLLSLGFSAFTQYVAVFMMEKFDYQESDLGMLFLYMGVWIAFTQGMLTRILAKRVPSQKVLRVSLLSLGLFIPTLLLPSHAWVIYAIMPFVALSNGVTGPNLNSLISSQASPDQQGRILGINQSIFALGNAIPSVLAAFLSTLNPNGPLIASGICIVLAWVTFSVFFKGKEEKSTGANDSLISH